MKIRQIDIKGERYDVEAFINPIPTGAVLPFAGTTAPEGFLLCDGSEVSRVTYAKLFGVIGEIYGKGDSSTTFNLPNYCETVLVGAGASSSSKIRAHDIYEVGEFKDDQMQGHEHKTGKDGYFAYVSSGGTPCGDGDFGNVNTKGVVSDGTNGTPRIGSTTHGKQIGVNFIIKV